VRLERAQIRGEPGKPGDDEALALTQQMTLIARSVLDGRAAMMDHRYGEAAAAFRQAAELQEDPKFSAVTDPPAWYYPVRRDLAAALFAGGNLAAARHEAEATLTYRPKDPFALALISKLGN
jgi:tetratricopeptide (TPR) repeat protein